MKLSKPKLKYRTLCSLDLPPDPSGPTVTAHSSHDGHLLSSTWAMQGGRAEPIELIIRRAAAEPITASAIRQLPLGDMLDESRRLVSTTTEMLSVSPVVDASAYQAFAKSGPQRGRSLTPEVLEEVADVYRTAYFAGRSVQAAVANHFVISPDAATKRIMKARAAGLLDGIGRATK